MAADLGSGLTHELNDIKHVVVVLAEDCSWEDHADLAAAATVCRAYHLTPAGEDRRGWWAEYAEALSAAGYRVTCGALAGTVADDLRSGRVADLTFLDADAPGLGVVLDAWLAGPPPETLLALALAGGDALDVIDAEGRLGPTGIVLLLSPWSPGGWVSEEVLDHASFLQFCERWTEAHGRTVPAAVPPWRRQVVGDLVGALTLGEIPPELAARTGEGLARPVPYFPVADLLLDDEAVRLMLANVGPTATRSVPFAIDDGDITHRVVPPSPVKDPSWVEVPVTVRDGRYEVSVRGPDHFRRRFAGVFPSPARCGCAHFPGGDIWFPDLEITVGHTTTLPTFFWLTRRLGTRFGGETSERLIGPRRTATFREQPAARTMGWYDLSVTTSADPEWVQEYAGHLHAGNRPSVAAPPW